MRQRWGHECRCWHYLPRACRMSIVPYLVAIYYARLHYARFTIASFIYRNVISYFLLHLYASNDDGASVCLRIARLINKYNCYNLLFMNYVITRTLVFRIDNATLSFRTYILISRWLMCKWLTEWICRDLTCAVDVDAVREKKFEIAPPIPRAVHYA